MHLNDESSTSCLDNKKSTDSQATINNNSGHSGDTDSLILQSSSDCNVNPISTSVDTKSDHSLAPGSSSDNHPLPGTTNPKSLVLDDQLIVDKSLTNSIDDGHPPPPTNPNELSIMQGSTDLHWFNEEAYQSERTHLIENMPIISESSSNTESSNRTVGGNLYHHQNRYHVLSRNIDATLAEIDMETFTSEDINHLYSTLPEFDSSCSGAGGTVTEDGGEEFASVTGSLLDEIHSDSHYLSSKRFNSHGVDLNGSSSIFDSSLIVDEASVKTLSSGGCGGGTLTMRSERLPGLYERSPLDVSGVFADSLDFSSSENDNNTNEMILRCREQDKTKYTIAFEESVSSVTTFSDSADDTKNNSEESDTVTHFNHPTHHHHHGKSNQHQIRRRRMMNGVNFISVNNNDGDGDDDDYDLDEDYRHHHANENDLVKSEYTTWNMVKRRGPSGRRELIKLRRYPFRPIAKQSQSLPNIVQVTSIITGDHGEPLFPPLGSYVPLYDLNKSNTTNSSNSEVSPPRSLIRLFIKNRTSPTSSSPGSSSTSFEGHFIDSSELIHGHHHHGLQPTPPGGSGSTKRGGGGPNGQYFYGDKEGNVRVSDKRTVGQQCQGDEWNNFEDSLVTDGVNGHDTGGSGGAGAHVTLLPPKTGFSRMKQASPIREEDVTSDTSRGDEAIASGTDESYHGKDGKLVIQHWPNYHFDKFKNNPNNGNTDRVNVIGARRSISVDRFMPTQCTGVGCGGDMDGTGLRGGGGCDPASAGASSNNARRSSDHGSTNTNKIRFSSGREFGSVSSGYLSSRQGSSEWHRKTTFAHQHQPPSSQSQPKPSSSSSSLPHQYPLNPSSSSSSIPSKRYSISVTTMKTASTQVPVHIQDKQVQTATTSTATHETGYRESDPSTGFIIREYPTSTVRDKSIPLSSIYAKESNSPSSDHHHHPHPHQDEPQHAKPLYVCFPNYSLPDLSFLRTFSCPCTPKDDGPSAVYLSPTKLKLPVRETQPTAACSGGGIRRPLGKSKGTRPKSCTDYENLIANRGLNHIKDWDSLKVLLPSEFKSLIARLEGGGNQPNGQPNQDAETRKSTNPAKDSGQQSVPVTNTNPFSVNYKEPKPIPSPGNEVKVKLRPRKKPIRNCDGYPCPAEAIDGGCGCQQERKRHSLQEPASDYLGHHPHQHGHYPNPHHEPEDVTNCTYRNTISRSVTMPSCICHSQPPPVCHLNCCQPYNYYPPPCHDHHLYQHTPHPVHHKSQSSPIGGVNSCCQGGTVGGGGVRTASMSTNVKSNDINSSLINGLFDDPSVDRLCHLLSKGMSVKNFTNIIGGGVGGQSSSSVGGMTHKNRLTSPSKPYEPIKEQVIEETDSMCISSTGNQPTTDCQSNDQPVTQTIKDDQSKINSNFKVIKKRWESLASPVSSTINSIELNQTPTINGGGNGGRGKPTSTPPPPTSTTPSTSSSNYSSPPPSSTTSSSAFPAKPKVPIKPPLSSLRPTSVPIAKRPTTLGANNANVFKSMIPIAKGSKSPPNVKQLTSPISKTLPRTNSKKASTKRT